MSKRFFAGAIAALSLVGCASAPPSPPPTVDTDAIDRIFSNVPVLEDDAPARLYTPAQAASLERRDGYLVDRSTNAPSHNERVRFLIIHYTGGDEVAAMRALTGSNVSAHYLVTAVPGRYRDRPVVMQLVDEERRAWHAGVSRWGNRDNLNDTSIGIEIVNRGHYASPEGRVWAPYSSAQIELVTRLARDIVNRYDIAPENVLGHSDVSPGRKIDPGPFFPWQRLHEAGVGAWPEREAVVRYRRELSDAPLSAAGLQEALSVWGYAVPTSGTLDDRTRRVLRAFQSHFRASDTDGEMDIETQAILLALVERYHGSGEATALLRRR